MTHEQNLESFIKENKLWFKENETASELLNCLSEFILNKEETLQKAQKQIWALKEEIKMLQGNSDAKNLISLIKSINGDVEKTTERTERNIPNVSVCVNTSSEVINYHELDFLFINKFLISLSEISFLYEENEKYFLCLKNGKEIEVPKTLFFTFKNNYASKKF